MDILQLIKATNKEILDRLNSVAEAYDTDPQGEFLCKWANLYSFVHMQLKIKSEYLYPEVSVISPHLAKKSQQLELSLDQLRGLLESQSQNISVGDKKVDLKLLNQVFVQHFETEESGLIPGMRQKMSTEEREELSQVFQDAVDEWKDQGDLTSYAV